MHAAIAHLKVDAHAAPPNAESSLPTAGGGRSGRTLKGGCTRCATYHIHAPGGGCTQRSPPRKRVHTLCHITPSHQLLDQEVDARSGRPLEGRCTRCTADRGHAPRCGCTQRSPPRRRIHTMRHLRRNDESFHHVVGCGWSAPSRPREASPLAAKTSGRRCNHNGQHNRHREKTK